MATINGTPGNDKLLGTNEEDLIRGFGGNDRIEGFGEDDVIDGGSGTDTAIYRHSDGGAFGGAVSVDLGSNQDAEGGDAEGDSLLSIENLIGSDIYGEGFETRYGEGDILKGNDGDNKIEGLEGDDDLYGHRGDDVLLGGDHNDF